VRPILSPIETRFSLGSAMIRVMGGCGLSYRALK
jgi:hypothetical protein